MDGLVVRIPFSEQIFEKSSRSIIHDTRVKNENILSPVLFGFQCRYVLTEFVKKIKCFFSFLMLILFLLENLNLSSLLFP